jgi:ribosome-binding ATPase YchF (GTP1/OBG family)
MAEFSKEERKEFFEEPGLEGSGLQKLIHEGYDILGLITF